MDAGSETFTEHFNRLTADMTNAELCVLLDVTDRAVRKLRSRDTQSLTLARDLVFAKHLGITPWFLQYGTEEPRKRR